MRARARVAACASAGATALLLLALATPSPARAALSIDATGCSPANVAAQVTPPALVTTGTCTIAFGDSAGTADLRLYQQDGSGVAMAGLLDYDAGTANWGVPAGPAVGTNMFGACLATATANVTTTWTEDASGVCAARDDEPWRPVVATSGTSGALVGTTNVATQTGTVAFTFGMRVPANQAAGAYAAPVVFEVVSTVVNTPPTTPTYVSPAAAEVVSATPALVATFNDADTGQTGTLSFEVRQQVTGACSTSGTLMGSGTATGIVAGSNGTWNYTGAALVAGVTYCWRVMATDAASSTSGWTTLRAFTINSAPTAPTLVSPAAGGTVTTTTPGLTATFNDVDAGQAGTLAFEVRLQVTGACSTSGTLMGSGSSGSTTAGANGSWTYTGTALVVGTTYCWRAAATDAAGATGAWSALQSFAVAAAATTSVMSGWELGTTGTQGVGGGIQYFRTVNGPPSIDTTIVRNGRYSMHVDAPSENLMLDGAGGVSGTTRFAVYFETLPTSSTKLQWFGDWIANVWAIRFDAATGRLAAQVNADPMALGPVVTTGRWYVIEVGLDATGPNFALPWRVDGVAQATATSTLAAPGGAMGVQYLWFGTDAGGTGGSIYYDDVLQAAGGYPLGDGRVIPLRPNGIGTLVAGIQNDDNTAAGAGSWSRLVDAPMSGILDYLKATNTTGSAQVLVEDTGASFAANAIRGTLTYHASGTSPNSVTTSTIYNDGSTAVFSSGDFSESTIFDTTRVLAKPVAGWTPTEVNGLSWQLGPASDINPIPYWDALLLEVDYPLANSAPAAPPLVTPTAGATGVAATPVLSATMTDVDFGQTGRITFEVRQQVTGACSAAGTLMGSGTTNAFALEGTNGSWTYSGTPLVSATTYCWRARATDSSNATGAWSALRAFTRS